MSAIPIIKLVFQRVGDIEYHKSVPQTEFEMLGLNVREDFTGAHAYLYKNGREIDKGSLVWWVNDSSLLRTTASPARPLVLTLPRSVSTFACTTPSKGTTVIEIRRSDNRIVVTPDRETPLAFVAFTGSSRKWKALSTSSYAEWQATNGQASVR